MYTVLGLNNYMKIYDTGKIMPEIVEDVTLLNELMGCVNKDNFVGQQARLLMELSAPHTAKAHYGGADIPAGGGATYLPLLYSTKEIIANAQITRQAMKMGTGGDGSWGNVLERGIALLKRDMKMMANHAALSDGTAQLGRIASLTSGDGTAATPWLLVFDNTYSDFAFENTMEFMVGQKVDIYSGDTAVVLNGTVTAKAPGRRTAASGWVATTGTASITGVLESGQSLASPDNYLVYVADSKVSGNYYDADTRGLPIGLKGLFTDGVIYGPATFQGQARSSYSSLRAKLFCAAAGGLAATNGQAFGLLSESPAFGTPTAWDLSNIDDALMEVMNGDGGGRVKLLLTTTAIGRAIARKSDETHNVNVVISDTGKKLKASGEQLPDTYIDPNGNAIPIKYCKNLPPFVLYGIDTNDVELGMKEDFDFLRETGDIWEVTRGDRKTNFEAPYHGEYQFAMERCDNSFVMMDMRPDV